MSLLCFPKRTECSVASCPLCAEGSSTGDSKPLLQTRPILDFKQKTKPLLIPMAFYHPSELNSISTRQFFQFLREGCQKVSQEPSLLFAEQKVRVLKVLLWHKSLMSWPNHCAELHTNCSLVSHKVMLCFHFLLFFLACAGKLWKTHDAVKPVKTSYRQFQVQKKKKLNKKYNWCEWEQGESGNLADIKE